MKAYVISEVEVLDESDADAYRRFAAASIAEYGGRYLVRGVQAEVVEGGPMVRQIVIVEFPSLERVREWYASPAYAEALRFREEALDRRLMFVEGVAPDAVQTEDRA
jgi:uncharacterized protein (DUF1330 family)